MTVSAETLQLAAFVIGGLLMAFAVYKAVRVLLRRRRSSAENNWVNEAYAARREAKTWTKDG